MKSPYWPASLILIAASLPAWAVDAPVSGVPRFYQVNDHICRGGQPSSEGWNSLARLGVKTVVDLRPEGEHSTKAEARAVEAAGMKYVNIPLSGLAAPTDEKMVQLLTILEADSKGLVFVHCRRGADRTGTVIACYRIACEHWEKRKALAEAQSFGMSWLEFAMQRYVLNFHPPAQLLP